MQQVLIEFTSDASGMAPAEKALSNLTDSEKKLADQSIKTADKVIQQGKTTAETTKATTKSVDQLVASMKNVDKAVIGSAYKKTFEDIRRNLSLTDKELKAFYQNIIKNSRAQLLDSNLAKEDFDVLQELVKSTQQAMDDLGKAQDDVGTKSVSMRARLKELKTDLQNLEDQGKDNTREFEAMAVEAGKLQDQIGDTNARIAALSSDTFAFDAIASGIQGVAGAFAVAQGAAALFGSENEEVQQALLKVNAAMAILQGLQTVQNVLQKQSAASIAVDLVLRRNEAAAMTAQTLATEGAVVAQEELNGAMAANPVGIILIGITALITAISLFSSNQDAAAEATKELNELLLQEYELNNDLNSLYPTLNQRIKDNLELQLKLLEVTNASVGAQLSKKKELADINKTIAETEVKRLEQQNGSLDTNLKKLQAVDEQLKKSVSNRKELIQLDQDFQKAAGQGDLQNAEQIAAAKRVIERQALTEKQTDALKAEKATLDKIVTDQKAANETLKNSFVEVTTLTAEQIRKNYEDNLKSVSAFADAEVAIRKRAVLKAQVDSIASIEAVSKAERNAIREKANEELKTNNNLTPGERAKINAETNLAILENYRAFNDKLLENQKDVTRAQLSIAKEGSREELDTKLALLKLEQQDELNAAEITSDKKREIDNRFFKQRLDMVRAYNKQVAEDAVNTGVADTSSQLSSLQRANVSATNSQLLKLKQDLIDQQAQLEVISVEYSEKNEELRRVKIKAIYDQALADKRKLEEDKIKAEITRDDAFLAKINRLAVLEQEAAINSNKLTVDERKEAVRKIAVLIEAANDAEFSQLEDLHNLKLISEEEYLDKLEDLKIKKAEATNEKLIQLEDIRRQRESLIRDTAFNAANQIIDALSSNQQAVYADELAAAKELYDQKFISEKEYNNRQKQLKRQAAIAEKEAALFQIFLETQQKAMAIQAQRAVYLSNPITAPLAALASTQLISLYITEAITAGLLAGRKLPAFRHGVIDMDGPGSTISDSIIARLSKGESVMTAAETQKHKPALTAMRNDTFEHYLKTVALPKYYPAMPSASKEALAFSQTSLSIDYSEMAKHISNELKDNPMLVVKFDKVGIETYLQQRSSITQLKNRDFEI